MGAKSCRFKKEFLCIVENVVKKQPCVFVKTKV